MYGMKSLARSKKFKEAMMTRHQERIAAITGIIFAILGGIYGIWIGFEAESRSLDTLAGALIGATVGYFFGIFLGVILAASRKNGNEL